MTGMDDTPVAQTFFVDEEMQQELRLDGIVTLVDANHIWQHIESREAQEQLAFADVVSINKTDLADETALSALESRIREMNAFAKVHRTGNAVNDLDRVLNLGAFNLDRALEVEPKFMEPEFPFEWAGVYRLAAGSYQLRCQEGPEPEVNLAVVHPRGIGGGSRGCAHGGGSSIL
jgi:G3E family GTPase